MPIGALELAEIRQEVRTELGSCMNDGAWGIVVELEDEHIDNALKRALRIYNRSRPRHGNAALAVTAGQKKYGPINDAIKGFQGVLSVSFVDPDRLASADIDPFEPFLVYSSTGLSTGGDTIGEWMQRLQYNEQARNVTSSEPEWKGQWESRSYYLYIDIHSDYLCSFEYTWHVTPDNNKDTGLQFIPDGDADWIIDYTTARAKQVLSRIRGKFQGVPGPDGGESPVDWSELMSEGREDQTRLEEEIQKRRRPLPPILG